MTSSKQEVVKTGAVASTIKVREEYEPLGQSVRMTAPVVVDPPSGKPAPPIMDDSLFPESQCLLPLKHLPRHCSQAAEQNVWNEIHISWQKKEGNLSKITDLPLPDIYNNSSSNEIMG